MFTVFRKIENIFEAKEDRTVQFLLDMVYYFFIRDCHDVRFTV